MGEQVNLQRENQIIYQSSNTYLLLDDSLCQLESWLALALEWLFPEGVSMAGRLESCQKFFLNCSWFRQKTDKRRMRAQVFWPRLNLLLSAVFDSLVRKCNCLKTWLKASSALLTPIHIPDFRTPVGLVFAVISQPLTIKLHCYHAEQKECCQKQRKTKNQSIIKKVIVEQAFSVTYKEDTENALTKSIFKDII